MYLVWGIFKQMVREATIRIANILPRQVSNGWQNLPYPNDSPHDQHPHRQDRPRYLDDAAVLFYKAYRWSRFPLIIQLLERSNSLPDFQQQRPTQLESALMVCLAEEAIGITSFNNN